MQNKGQNSDQSYQYLLSLGIEMAVTMILPVLAGWWIDKKFDTRPWGILGGAIFGFISVFWLIYKKTILKK